MNSTKRLLVASCISLMLYMLLTSALVKNVSLAFTAPASTTLSSSQLQLYPAPNAHNVPITTTISIVISETVDTATVTTGTIFIYGIQSGWLTPTFRTDNGTITATISPPLWPGEIAAVSITTETRGIDGQSILSPTVWQFRSATKPSTGHFVDTEARLGDQDSRAVALGDLDNDGDLDAYVANCGLSGKDPTDTILFNDGSGGFTDSGQTLDTSCGFSVALGDLDNDHDLDAVIGTSSSSANFIMGNDSSGVLTKTQVLSSSAGVDIALGDINGDGYLDIMMTHDTNSWSTWINAGDGTFPTHRQFDTSNSNVHLSLGDIDNDLDLDLFIIGRRVDTIWFNDGAGNFSIGSQTFEDSDSFEVDSGDFDDDGDLDFVIGVIGPTEQTNKILWNDGTGNFIEGEQALSTNWSHGLSVGDINGDGSLDLFGSKAVNLELTHSELWVNDGTGTFTDSGQALVGIYVTDNALGDIDGDGDLDLFITDTTDGFFTPPRSTPNTVWQNLSIPEPVQRVYLPDISR